MKVTIPAKIVEISRCYHECPHFGLDGGPSPAMICNHPFWNDKEAYSGFIISHPECDTGFPSACPLFGENGMEPPPVKKEKRNRDYVTDDEIQNLPFDQIMSLEIDRRLIEALTENVNNSEKSS